MTVAPAEGVDDELLDALRRLLPQLSSSADPPSRADLEEIVASPATALLVAREGEGGPILGVLTLATFRIPTGVRAWIEDVVVDGAARGQGVGRALTEKAVELGQARGARTVDLTSRPERDAANRLYLRAGFTVRATNVYRRTLG
ncbi:MAG: GNAT family N-acetyltransferase [Acidimicrobiales bacterium]